MNGPVKSPPPRWNEIGLPVSADTRHSGSQCGSPSSGRSKRWGSPENRIARWPSPAPRSTSATVASMSQNGTAVTGSSRSGSVAAHSVIQSL